MKKQFAIPLVILLFIVVIMNTPIVRFLFDAGRCYGFSTQHGDFYGFAYEHMAPKSKDVIAHFERFKAENPQTQDTVLYRLFKRNPLHVWNWGAYLTHPRYELPYPYLPPGEVKYRKPPNSMQMCNE